MCTLLKDGTVFRAIRLSDISGYSLVPSNAAETGEEELVVTKDKNAYPPDCEPAHIIDINKKAEFGKTVMTFVFEGTEEDDLHPAREDPGGFTVLCAEDNLVNQRVLEAYLRRFQQDHVIVDNGQDAVEAYKTDPERFRCILMDISMPVMSGIEATRRIRDFESERTDLRAAFIVGLVATALPASALALTEHGFDAFLSKPISIDKTAGPLFGGPESNVVSLYGRLTERERRPFPLSHGGRRAGLASILGRCPRGKAIAGELCRMKDRGEVPAGRARIDVRVEVIRRGRKGDEGGGVAGRTGTAVEGTE